MEVRQKPFITRLLAGLGYLSLLWEWFFIAVAYLSLASHTKWFNDAFILSIEREPVRQAVVPTVGAMSGWMVGCIAIVVILVIGIALIYALRRLPGSILKGGETITHAPAQALAPLILRHAHVKPTKKRQLRLTARLVWIMKALLLVLPFCLLIPLYWVSELPVPLTVMFVAISFFALAAILCFGLEWLMLRFALRRPKKTD